MQASQFLQSAVITVLRNFYKYLLDFVFFVFYPCEKGPSTKKMSKLVGNDPIVLSFIGAHRIVLPQNVTSEEGC